MSEEEEEKKSLRLIFYGVCFFLLGVLFRHLGKTYKLKTDYTNALFLIGVLVGYLSKYVEHMQDPILQYCGPFCFQSLYIPIYFFEGGFLLVITEIRPKIILFSLLILLPIWLITGSLITVIGVHIFPYDLNWQSYVILCVLALIPDVQALRSFLRSRSSAIDPALGTLLEFESLMASFTSVFVFHLALNTTSAIHVLPYHLFEAVFTCVLGIFSGKAVFFWLKRVHNDMVTQTTIFTSFIFITYSSSAYLEFYPAVAIIVMSLVMIRAKPTVSGKSIEFILHFIEIFRFALMSILVVVAGMEFATKMWPLMDIHTLIMSVVIFMTAHSVRFFILLFSWLLYHRYFFKGLYEVLLIWACSIRGPFNIVLSLTFILSEKEFFYADERLYLLANFQIILCFFATVPIAKFILYIFRERSIDYEKVAMIYRCAHMLKGVKDSYIDVLRKMAFSADADWDVVIHRTYIKKRIFKKYESKNLLVDSLPKIAENFEKRIRRDSVYLLLRTQRSYLGEQFEDGLVTGQTAKVLTLAIMQAYRKKSMLNGAQVLATTAPNKYLVSLHQELTRYLSVRGTSIRNKALLIFISFNLSVFANRLMAIVFSYTDHFSFLFLLMWIYNVIFTMGVAIYLCKVAFYRQKNSWNCLLLVTLILSIFEVLNDFRDYRTNMPYSKMNPRPRQVSLLGSEQHSLVTFLEIMFSAGVTFIRMLTIAYCIPFVKKGIALLVRSLLSQTTFSQCEAELTYMTLAKDSLHHLPDSNLDPELIRNMQLILHQEHLFAKQRFGLMEILVPAILTALKTYIASNLILNSQLDMVAKLRYEGILEDIDLAQLKSVIHEKRKQVNHLPSRIEPLTARDLLYNVPSFTGNLATVSLVLKFGINTSFKPGDIILHQGHNPHGMYLILSGLVRGECHVISNVHHDIPRNPVYYSTHEICTESGNEKVELTNFFTAGTIFGERSILTSRPGHKTIRCVTCVEALFIPERIIENLMGGKVKLDQPVSTLESDMWRTMVIRMASRLIQGIVSGGHLLTRRKVYHMLESARLIFGNPGTVLSIELKSYLALILCHGILWTTDREYHYEGPCFIPHRIAYVDLVVGSGQRAVILVVPSHDQGDQEDSEWGSLRRRYLDTGGSFEEFDDLTSSSDSSDGIPHKRYRDSLVRISSNFEDFKRKYYSKSLRRSSRVDEKISKGMSYVDTEKY